MAQTVDEYRAAERKTDKARIAELENAISKALRHAEKNGMKDWPVFLNLRKVYNARKEDTNF